MLPFCYRCNSPLSGFPGSPGICDLIFISTKIYAIVTDKILWGTFFNKFQPASHLSALPATKLSEIFHILELIFQVL